VWSGDWYVIKYTHCIIVFVGIILSACGTLPPEHIIADAPQDAGISKDYTGDPELIIAAAQASVQGLELNVTHTERTDKGYFILFTKSMSAFSWGETGRVLIANIDTDSSRVYVHSRKNLVGQISGTDEEEFAAAIFEGMDQVLASRKQ
jgi:hypothetical protein